MLGSKVTPCVKTSPCLGSLNAGTTTSCGELSRNLLSLLKNSGQTNYLIDGRKF